MFEPADDSARSRSPFSLNASGWVPSASSWPTPSISRHGASVVSRTSSDIPPSGSGRDGTANVESAVGDESDESGILDDLLEVAALELERVHVMELRVVSVEPDEDAVREVLVDVLDASLHALERREIASLTRREVDVVNVPVLVAARVLEVDDATVVGAPEELADASIAVGRDARDRRRRRRFGPRRSGRRQRVLSRQAGVPSGEIRGEIRSGFPNRISRGTSGGRVLTDENLAALAERRSCRRDVATLRAS